MRLSDCQESSGFAKAVIVLALSSSCRERVCQPKELHSCSLAQLGLARAYALQGDALKAKAAYQDFLALWKDADPDIRILTKAKAEYVKLQ
jgi:hypothetical protein